MAERWRIKKGDMVQVIAGGDKGKQGEIISVDRDRRRVTVKGVNLVTKHRKPSHMHAGGKEQMEASVHASNVMLLDKKENKPTRVGVKFTDEGKKVRVSKISGEVIGE